MFGFSIFQISICLFICVQLIVSLDSSNSTTGDKKCPPVKRGSCCNTPLTPGCRLPRQCYKFIMANCPDRKIAVFSRKIIKDRRMSPRKQLGKCGTAEVNYQPCTSKGIANKLFLACCQLYVPEECHHMCAYETDQSVTRNMLVDLRKNSKCRIKHLSSILYCASQNRDNRKCCLDLDLNAPQLQVGSRCLRMCDPSGTSIDRITKEDVTCLYNWNVIMYCHHAGIREM